MNQKAKACNVLSKPILTFHPGPIPAYAGGVSNPTWNTDVWINNIRLARSQ